MKDYRLLIGAILIIIGFWGHKYPDLIKSIKDKISSQPIVLMDTKPSEAVLKNSVEAASLVTDRQDRLDFAIFNIEFAKRLDKYFNESIGSQELADLYASSLKNYFKDRLKDKYSGLNEKIQSLLEVSISDVDHILSKTEIESLKENLLGLSWNLSN
jgi:hypothetical protein